MQTESPLAYVVRNYIDSMIQVLISLKDEINRIGDTEMCLETISLISEDIEKLKAVLKS